MRNYVKDNRRGVITEIVKHKPENVTAKGIATMQLTNVETGEVDYEVRSENIIMDFIGKNAYNYAFFTRMSGLDGGTLYPFDSIHLTNWNEDEKANTPCFLGVRRGWAHRTDGYVGTDTLRGTINSAETRTYVNNDGKYVMSFVFDWPTHAANGTFNSILWTSSTTPNHRDTSQRGSIWFAPYSINSDIRDYLRHTGFHLSYDEENDYLCMIANEISTDKVPVTNPYKGTYSGFRFKRGTSELIDEVRYMDSDGNPLPLYPRTANRMLSDGRTVYAYYYGTNSADLRHKYKHYTIEVYNNEGVLTNRTHYDISTKFKNSDGIDFTNISTIYEHDGTIRFYGYYKVNDTYDNVIIRHNIFTDTTLETIHINKKLYIPHYVENVNSVRISNTMTGRNIVSFEFTYTKPDLSTATFGGTYDVSDIRNIKFLNEYYGTTVSNGTSTTNYEISISGEDFNLFSNSYSSTTYVGVWDGRVWRQSNKWGHPSSHTLLAAPVTKTQSHTMKLTYEIIVDTIDIYDFKSFFNK